MIDKYNPYGIKKDYECKTCFGEFYSREIENQELSSARLTHKRSYNGQIVDFFSMDFHPICPKCGDRNMKVIVHSFSEGSWDDLAEGKAFSFGFRYRGLGCFMSGFFYVN